MATEVKPFPMYTNTCKELLQQYTTCIAHKLTHVEHKHTQPIIWVGQNMSIKDDCVHVAQLLEQWCMNPPMPSRK